MKLIELRNPEYIPVHDQGVVSFGGNQCWFSTEQIFSREYSIHKWGCGVIAMADLCLYLARSDDRCNTPITALAYETRQFISKEYYMMYLEMMHNHYAPVLPGSGMTGLALAHAVRRYVLRYRLPIRVAWKAFMDDEVMIKTIRKMIKDNFPVILSIGPNMPMVFMKHGVTLYTKSKHAENTKLEHFTAEKVNVHKHFVTVTGLVALKNKQMMLKVSSWGKEYYIHYQELRDYIENHGDRLTSSLLYLSWK